MAQYAEQAPQLLALYNLILLFLLKITALVLGYLTIRLGHNLIREGFSGGFKFTGEMTGVKAALSSGSPGLLFVLLGCFLIAYAIYVEKVITLEPVVNSAASQMAIPKPPELRPQKN